MEEGLKFVGVLEVKRVKVSLGRGLDMMRCGGMASQGGVFRR